MDKKTEEALTRLSAASQFWQPQLQKDLASLRQALDSAGRPSAERAKDIDRLLGNVRFELKNLEAALKGGVASPRSKRGDGVADTSGSVEDGISQEPGRVRGSAGAAGQPRSAPLSPAPDALRPPQKAPVAPPTRL